MLTPSGVNPCAFQKLVFGVTEHTQAWGWRVNEHVVNQMCILGIQLDFVHVWDRHCQALFVFPALSSHVSAALSPASLGLVVGWSREQGMEDGGRRSSQEQGMEWDGTGGDLRAPSCA